MAKKFNYVYLITNLINDHKYVGEHSTDKNPFEDNYFGSGHLLSKKIKEYGKENFVKEILEFFPTKQEAYDAQAVFIKMFETHISQKGYNGDWTGGWHADKDCTLETKLKQSKSRKGKPTWMKGKHHKKESIEKLREARKKQIPWNKGKHTRQVPWNKGGHHSEESKEKMRKSHTGLKQSKETIEKRVQKIRGKPSWQTGKKCPKLGDHSRGKTYEEIYGFEKAQLKKKNMRQSMLGKNTGKGKFCWVNNGVRIKRVELKDLDEHLKMGWRRGRKI